MSFMYPDMTWCTVEYMGKEYGVLDGFHFAETLMPEIRAAKEKDPSKYIYASLPTIRTKPKWRIDESGRLWLEEIRALVNNPPPIGYQNIKLPHHPYPILGTWVKSMRLRISSEIISPNKTGRVTVLLEILRLWFEEGKVVKTERSKEEVSSVKLGNYIEE